MKYSIREYALAHNLTIHMVFTHAWREHFDRTPDFFRVKEDVQTYIKYGAIPPYVASFMKDKYKPRVSKDFKPYWVMA